MKQLLLQLRDNRVQKMNLDPNLVSDSDVHFQNTKARIPFQIIAHHCFSLIQRKKPTTVTVTIIFVNYSEPETGLDSASKMKLKAAMTTNAWSRNRSSSGSFFWGFNPGVSHLVPSGDRLPTSFCEITASLLSFPSSDRRIPISLMTPLIRSSC